MAPVRRLGLKALDALQYAVAVNAVLVAVLGPASLLVTGGLIGLKWLLFVAGVGLIGLGGVELRPAPAWTDDPRIGVSNSHADGGFGGAVGRLPPLAWYDPAREDRLSDGARHFYAGLAAWAVSFALETVLGVGVPAVG